MDSWLQALPTPTREAVYAWMRAQGDRAMRYQTAYVAMAPRYGEIAVGAAHFDEWIKAEGIQEYLSSLRVGYDPVAALERTQVWAHNAVFIHNSRRPKDICWQRWEGTVDAFLEQLHRTLLKVVVNGD